jgi:hypothetical protein
VLVLMGRAFRDEQMSQEDKQETGNTGRCISYFSHHGDKMPDRTT